jgi:RHS repeat-associated protein
MKFSPPILSCSNENICFQVGDYSFGFNGKDKESEFNSGAYDFGARIHDARLGRWMSVDRFVKQYASQTPYAYSNDSPILFIDIDGEKGTIYIQVMLDKN